jgi:hypothetical protein
MKTAEGINAEEVTEPKLTIKQEKFAQAYVETGNASEAYRRAYDAERMKDKQIWEEACKRLKTPKVSPRVDQLKAANRERHEITVDDLVVELEAARTLAERIESPSAMVAASLGKGKLLGLVIDRGELTGKNGKPLIPENASAKDIAVSVMAMLGQARVEDPPNSDEPSREIEASAEVAPEAVDEPKVWTFNPATGKLE